VGSPEDADTMPPEGYYALLEEGMSYAPIELGRRKIIIQEGEPTFIEAASMNR